MKEIIFKHWKADALRGRNKVVGKIVKNYWRLHYNADEDTVTFWQRPYDKSTNSDTMNDETLRVFTIDNQSNLTLNVSNTKLDQSLKSVLGNYIHLFIKIIPSTQRKKYIAYETHEFQHQHKTFIYVQNQTVFNTYGNLIQLGDYQIEEIDKEFNSKITKFSRAFREKLNVMGNLLNLNLTKTQIYDRYKGAGNSLHFNITEKEIYHNIQVETLTPAIFTTWQKFSYLFDSSYFHHSNKKEPLLDVRKQAQKAINKSRKEIAKMEGKIIYTTVKQDVNGPGIR